jgi:hypothetical protein
VRSSLAVLLALAACILSSGSARAFQNPDNFTADPTQGGGGGRFFTGSPRDAYTCEVCHHSESTPTVGVFGLPDGPYQPGALYRVTVDWPDDLARVALTMEMTDRFGRNVGTWSEPDLTTLAAADQCTLSTDTPTGARILPVAADRAVVSAIDCGQHQTTMNWTAPAQLDPLVPVQFQDAMLNGALVVSNTNGKLAGDSVAVFTHALSNPVAEPEPATSVKALCAVTTPYGAPPAIVLTIGLGVLSLLGLRARARHRRRRKLVRHAAGHSLLQLHSEEHVALDVGKRIGPRRLKEYV